MNFRREITRFKRDEVNIVTDLIFNKNVESNEEIVKISKDNSVEEEITKQIINALKTYGYIDYEHGLKLGDVSIKPLCVSLESLIQDGLYKPKQ